MSNPETDDKIIKLLERVAKAEGYKAGAWHRVIAEGKNYAMMKLNGSYVVQRNGQDCIIKVCGSNRDTYLKQFSENMLSYSLDAFAEEAMRS